MFLIIVAATYAALLLGLAVRMSRREDAPADMSPLDAKDAPVAVADPLPMTSVTEREAA